MSTIRTAALIPTYDNARTLAGVVEQTLEELPDVLVVNDGSKDGTAAILERFGAAIQVHHHPRNLGKGVALQSGFRILAERGFTHAISLDSDGQHFPEDVPIFLAAIEEHPDALIVGERDMKHIDVPFKSRFGHYFSNFSLRTLTGVRLADTQTGFRGYPLSLISEIEFEGTRFDFEMEVLVKSAWSGIPLVPVTIQVSYTPEGGRVTHFRPVRDFVHIAKLNLKLWLSRSRSKVVLDPAIRNPGS